MRKVATIFLIITILILIGLWSPWRGLNIDLSGLFGLSKQESLSGLQVYSLSGTLQIYIDDQLKGEVNPEQSPYFVDQIKPGEHLIKLVRKSDIPNAYADLSKLIQFEANTNVVISYNLGPEDTFTEGHVIYAVKQSDISKSTQLNIAANIEGYSVQLDTLPSEKVALSDYKTDLDLSSQHSIKLSKSGYETLEFIILPSTQDERDKLKVYDVNIEAHMMLQPVSVEDISTN